jgi:hypothetical protein
MAFELTIELVGLCLFVPDPQTETLYVLMPTADHGMDPHVARLCFDTAYARPGSTQLDGFPALVPADKTELALGTGAKLSLDLPVQLVNVGAVAKRPLRPGSLGGTEPPAQLVARVTLQSGQLYDFAPGACWNYPHAGERRHLANRIVWNVGTVDGDKLALSLLPLAGGGEATLLPPLYPIGGRIALQLYYTPRAELPPQPVPIGPPPVDTPAHHFAAYYELFEPPVADEPLPTYVGLSCGDEMGGSPYTCMAAQTPP